MRNTSQVRRITTALFLTALAAGCGGGDGPTAPQSAPESAPVRTTLILDFAYIEVIEDCDGIEGDGDFQSKSFPGSGLSRASCSKRPSAWLLEQRCGYWTGGPTRSTRPSV